VILVVGGAGAGKRAYAESLGVPRARMALAVHEKVLAAPALADDPAYIASLLDMDVVVVADVGRGVIPADPESRAAREAVGRLCCRLAACKETERVIRLACGVPQDVK